MSNKPFKMNVLEQCKITPPPNSTPSTSLLPLTFLDIPWLFFSPSQPLFLYEFPHSISHFTTTILPNLKQSLSFTLQHFYPFASTFNIPSNCATKKPHLFFTHNNSISLTIVESSGGDFNYLCSNYPRDSKDFHPLVPKLPSHGEKEFPLVAIQITIFPNVGISIGLCFHHVISDGRTFHNFLKTWASYCNLGAFSPNFPLKSLPICDKSVIIDREGLEGVFLEEWRKRRALKRISIGREEKIDLNKVRATFLVGPNELEKIHYLIVNCCKEKNYSLPVYLSPYVLGCAFLWVCLAKAQQSVNEEEAQKEPNYFGFIAGGITRLDYEVPKTYLGNCVGFGRASLRRKELVGEDGIFFAAKAIGSTVKKLDASIFDGAEKWILDWEVLLGSEQHVHVTWSPKLKLYELDFGWGRPKKIEEISVDSTRSVSLIESRDFEGGMEIGLSLPKNKMDAFSILFTKGLNALP